MADIESTDYDDCQNGYDYFRRMDEFTGTPEEIAEKQAKLRASFWLKAKLPKDFIRYV